MVVWQIHKTMPALIVAALLLIVASTSIHEGAAEKTVSADDEIVAAVMQRINESAVRDHIAAIQAFGPHPTGSAACEDLREYLVGRLEAWGLEVDVHNWSFRSYQGQNIVAMHPGSNPLLPPIAVSAHYDSAPDSPGADDDGSGVASVLAAARALREYSFNRTIVYLLFSGEEQGTLGSLCYARDLYHTRQAIAGVINLDGIGHTETGSGGRKVIVYEEPVSAWLADVMEEVASDFPDLVELRLKCLPNTGYSDHNSFLTYGYGALQVEEYEYNERFHTANDTLDYVNVTYVTHSARLTAGSLARMADNHISGGKVAIAAPQHDMLYLFNVGVLPLSRGMVVTLGPVEVVVEVPLSTESVTFYLDGQVVMVDEETPFTWTCREPLLWNHQIVVEARNDQGEVSVAQMNAGLSLF